ncbi:MAG: 5-bromo-4-chloroindolyl phosphate hydrolysis family protein [Pseudoruegeria sp.]
MAQKFGGQFSPDGHQASEEAPLRRNPYQGKKRSRAGGRTNLLFFVPAPLAIRAFTAEPIVMATSLAAFASLILAAWLTREGLLAEEAYDARKVARRPTIPRKIMASLLTGAGLGLAGLAWHGPIDALIFALLGAVVHCLSFGLDPLRNKIAEGVDTFQTDRVANAVNEAETHLKAMTDAIERVGDRRLQGRVEKFQASARRMFRTVEEDPRDLTAARKYLGVYLKGARDASVKFADLYERTQDSKARADYEELLNDLELNFDARTEKLLLDNKSDLNVEIDVLRERLQRDGIARS